jgi:hypothetical protein
VQQSLLDRMPFKNSEIQRNASKPLLLKEMLSPKIHLQYALLLKPLLDAKP